MGVVANLESRSALDDTCFEFLEESNVFLGGLVVWVLNLVCGGGRAIVTDRVGGGSSRVVGG